ncbi:hypothetical protein [Serratia rubidaea]|uniref:hypothetical protein n=1 Tax=Serratia rubidaea TaxID=61652 RepID=UPI001CDA62AB|nr:hypothetical protein [Serratia rubidaea]
MTDNSPLDPTSMTNCTGEVGEPAGQCNQEFTNQIKLVPVNGDAVVLKGVPWSVHFKNTTNQRGKTNDRGETERFKTSKPELFFALVGKLSEGFRKRGGSFGSLGEIEERKISLVTMPDYPEKEVPYCSGYDYITVVGARTAPRDWRWQGGYGLTAESKGNQYRFINCGIRQLCEFPPASKDNYSVQRIMVVFQQGYTEYDIGKINEYTEGHHARIVYVKNKEEFVDFLIKRKSKNRLIKEMVFFCHGIINIASFHYAGNDVEAGEFSINDIKNVYESIFDYDAEITTYACRAGISVGGGDFTGKDAGQKNSPAQKMADSWDVKVNAFEMRSSYVGIYGAVEEIKKASGYGDVIKKYQYEMDVYKAEKAKGNIHAKPPELPSDYDVNVRRHIDFKERTKNEKIGGPISPNGSWRYPRTGNTPAGLKKGLQPYQPTEWKLL